MHPCTLLQPVVTVLHSSVLQVYYALFIVEKGDGKFVAVRPTRIIDAEAEI